MRSVRFVAHERERLVVGERYPTERGGRDEFREEHLDALARYLDRSGTKAFALGHRSVTLRQQVGLLRAGGVSLVIYPKLAKEGPERDWRGLLLHMIRVVHGVRLAPQEHAPLKQRAGDLFELLLVRFLNLAEGIVREGLARAYREVEENGNAMRGRLLVGAHVRHNAVRRERLFVAYEVHDADNLHNRILHRALAHVAQAGAPEHAHRAEAVLTDFPEVATAPMRDAEWGALRFDRRTERYREALVLARMILRDERPDLRWGELSVFSLLIDMDHLFEAYLAEALRGCDGVQVHGQRRKRFWTPSVGAAAWAKPDLLLEREGYAPLVVDAKWKVPADARPADDDLRQLFAYLHTFGGADGALVYPRAWAGQVGRSGAFATPGHSGRVVFVDLFAGGAPDLQAFRASARAALGV